MEEKGNIHWVSGLYTVSKTSWVPVFWTKHRVGIQIHGIDQRQHRGNEKGGVRQWFFLKSVMIIWLRATLEIYLRALLPNKASGSKMQAKYFSRTR